MDKRQELENKIKELTLAGKKEEAHELLEEWDRLYSDLALLDGIHHWVRMNEPILDWLNEQSD